MKKPCRAVIPACAGRLSPFASLRAGSSLVILSEAKNPLRWSTAGKADPSPALRQAQGRERSRTATAGSGWQPGESFHQRVRAHRTIGSSLPISRSGTLWSGEITRMLYSRSESFTARDSSAPWMIARTVVWKRWSRV